ncbi:MAG: hypothetical protein ACPGNR_10000 [Paracoccaceae bacterium]
MITLPKLHAPDAVNPLEISVSYGPETGNSTETWLEIETDQYMYVHGHDIETKRLRITIVGEWERGCLNSILRGDDFADVVDAEVIKSRQTLHELSEVQQEILKADLNKGADLF